jgi:ATP/maltotriose-dependent transcriptional regulator MalT
MSKRKKPALHKINLPLQRGTLVERPHLLLRFAFHPVIAVIAPAGSGKTTLALQWANAFEGGVCWFSLKPEDDDARNFCLFVSQMLRLIVPDLSETPALLLTQVTDGNYEVFIDALTRELTAFDVHLAIIFDEVQIISKPALVQVLMRFIQRLPPRMQVVLVGRSLHPQLLEQAQVVTMNDLAFTMDETASVLAHHGASMQSPDRLNQIFASTEGWVMGVKLAGIALRSTQPASDLLINYSTQYLMDEALRQIPVEQMEFMLRTSICDLLVPALCDALTGRNDSADLLESLMVDGLFIIRVSQKPLIYRYHSLFQEMLQKRLQLQGNLFREMLRRVAVWYASVGQFREASAVAYRIGDLALIARYALETGKQIILFSDLFRFREWLAQYPPGLVDEQPRLHLFLLVADAMNRDRSAVDTHLQKLLALPDAQRWQGEIATARAFIAWRFDNDNAACMAHLDLALLCLPHDSLYIHVLHLKYLQCKELHLLAESEAVLEEQYRIANEINSPAAAVQVLSNLIFMRYNSGRFEDVMTLSLQAFRFIRDLEGPPGQFAMDAERAIGRQRSNVQLHRGEIAGADNTLKSIFRYPPEQGNPHLVWRMYNLMAEIRALQNDFASMDQMLKSAQILHGAINKLKIYTDDEQGLSVLMESLRARILLRWHDAAAARRWLDIYALEGVQAIFLTEESPILMQTAHVTAQAYIVLGDIPAALAELERVQGVYTVWNRQPEVAQVQALRALAHYVNGDEPAACAALDDTLERTLECGNVYVLALAGLFPLLRKRIVAFWEAGDDARADHLRRAIHMLRKEAPSLPLSPFTPAEEYVAKLIVQGCNTTEMAGQMGTSLSNVRHRIGSIYTKMLTHNREKLLERLRTFVPGMV